MSSNSGISGSRFVLLLGAVAVAGCSVGPDYQRPALRVPEGFKSAGTQPATMPAAARLDARWWRVFGDAGLTRLEEAAVGSGGNGAGSPTLQVAAARVVEARAASRSVKSAFYPVITADPSAQRSRTPGSKGSSAHTGNQFTIPFDLSYEVDIWGRVKRSYESSEATARAAAADEAVVMLTLTADIAQDYFELRGLDSQDRLLEESVQLYRQEINLIERQQKAGIANDLDMAQQQTLLSSALASQIEVRRQRADLEHALAILTGRPPADVSVGNLPIVGAPPVVPAGLPADLLKRRPDVAEAEENMRAANASVGVATANFYPVVQLTGAGGFESVDIQHVVDWESRFWSLGPSVSIPIFEGGRLNADLAQAKAKYDEVTATYRATVLTAFGDVEDALTDLHMRAESGRELGDAVTHAKDALRLSKVRYDTGVDSYLQVIDSQRTLLNNQLNLVQTDTLRYVSTVLLIKAMGGGWENPAATQPGLRAASHPATLPAMPVVVEGAATRRGE